MAIPMSLFGINYIRTRCDRCCVLTSLKVQREDQPPLPLADEARHAASKFIAGRKSKLRPNCLEANDIGGPPEPSSIVPSGTSTPFPLLAWQATWNANLAGPLAWACIRNAAHACQTCRSCFHWPTSSCITSGMVAELCDPDCRIRPKWKTNSNLEALQSTQFA
ncbi:hypothetical protein BJX65DRAFT_93334 [Aspergillus insuetus]